jgi:23S rRNA (cytidine2498-2'-O)-methyltransferase
MPKPSNLFLFATCQVGAETALKQELARVWPAFRFAYSRPGFLTFKLPAGAVPPDDLDLGSVFARAYGFSLGKATGATREERIRQVWELAGKLAIERVHVWPRDLYEPGAHDYEPGLTDEALEVAGLVANAGSVRNAPVKQAEAAAAMGVPLPGGATPPGPPFLRGGGVEFEIGRLALDVVLVEEGEWWVGYHRTRSVPSTWPGGLLPESLPADAVSRVYLKMLEAIRWAGFRIGPGQRVIEIGCAPGGASQVLLNLGANVVGVDPAEMHPLVLGHPRFRHIRRRSKEVPRREFLGTDWLTCDINLPPNYTLDAIEAVVSYPGVCLQGMLLTLKLIDWSLAAQIPDYLDRVRSWGFRDVEARQLHHNRREICVAASDFRPLAPATAATREAKTKRRPERGGTAAQRKINQRPKRTKSVRKGKTGENT